jgi:DNA repair photolyase
MYNQIFGAFSDNDGDPSSRISQANSCISLDPFTGCSLGCAYCYRHNSRRDDNSSKPVRIFKDEEMVDSLISNPYFIPNKTIIAMGIASTDSFLPQVRESSFGIMKLLANKGYKNPFWFVLKSGVPKGSYNDFKNIIDNGNKIIISVTYSGMPKEIEPFTGNRFANLKEAIDAGVNVSLHLRPTGLWLE